MAREREWVGEKDEGKGTLCQAVAGIYVPGQHLKPVIT